MNNNDRAPVYPRYFRGACVRVAVFYYRTREALDGSARRASAMFVR